jgi:DNA polymerase III subunit delta
MTALKASDVEAFLARPSAAMAVVLVFGPDAGLVSERAEAIIRASVDDPRDALSVTRISGDDLASDPARLVDEAQAIPMFGGRRAVWVRAGARGFQAAVEGLLALTLRECRVVIEAGDLRRNAPLRVLCERARNAAVIACYADDARSLQALIDDEMRAADLTVTPEARAALLPLLGGDRRASRNELRKLALFAHGRGTVELDDVLEVVGDASARDVDELVDAALAGRPREVETRYAKAIEAGTAPGTVVFAVLRQITSLHKARLNIESGSNVEREAEAMRLHFRRKPAVEAALRAWSAAGLAGAIESVGKTQLETRRQAALATTLTQRALLSLAMTARRKE